MTALAIRPSLVAEPVDGVLVLSGYRMRVAVERGHLLVEDGIADTRRTGRFSRIDGRLKRVVLIGHSGTVTLDAVLWLHDVGVPLVHLRGDGTLVLVASPSGAITPGLRRQQALAAETGLGGKIAEHLVRAKIEGQLHVLDRLPAIREARDTLTDALDHLTRTTTLQALRVREAVAAKAYWQSWRAVPVRFGAADRRRCPDHWQRFGGRASPLAGGVSPRKAVNPANAMLNYLYALLEAEARIAALGAGLDPTLGLLHVDARARDSLALDLMEPVRPAVDGYLLDMLARRPFARSDFVELGNGHCRLAPALAGELAATAPTWARAMQPIVRDVCAGLSEGRTRETAVVKGARRVARAYRTASAVAVGAQPDGRVSAEAGAKRRSAMRKVVEADREWRANAGRAPVLANWMAIQAGLVGVPLKRMMDATGLTKSACSLVRAGKVVPHVRHWVGLASTGDSGR